MFKCGSQFLKPNGYFFETSKKIFTVSSYKMYTRIRILVPYLLPVLQSVPISHFSIVQFLITELTVLPYLFIKSLISFQVILGMPISDLFYIARNKICAKCQFFAQFGTPGLFLNT